MEKFNLETPDIKKENELEKQAFIESTETEDSYEEGEILEQKENIDPDFGIQEGEMSEHKKQLEKSIEKYQGRKKEEEEKSALRKFLGI